MTGLIANVLLNVILVALLCATISYCYILNRRIQTLQDSKSELAALLKQFDESTVKASETIVAMQTASKKIGDHIQLRIDKANYLLDDLSYSIDKGTRLASQIEASFAVNRARSRADIDVQEPVNAPTAETTAEQTPPAPSPAKKSPASIEAILEKVVSRKQNHHGQGGQGSQNSGTRAEHPSRSRAEQELIDLIQSSRG